MNVGRFALTALKWIGRLLGFLTTPVGRDFAGAVFGEVVGKKMPKYLAFLDWLEKHAGAHTEVWRKIVEAKKVGGKVELSPDEVLYLWQFKRGWDRFLKKPLNKAANKLQLEEAAETLVTGMDEGDDLGEAFLLDPPEPGEPLDDDPLEGHVSPTEEPEQT